MSLAPSRGGRLGPRRIAVAMSGGVDSSVAAALLRKEGHELIGITVKLQECHEARASRSCCGVDAIARARAVAEQLGIQHYVLDCVSDFREQVLRPAWDEYAAGRTPNPCLLCNERIRFGSLLRWARQLGASLLATGHYARVTSSTGGLPSLLRGVDPGKDQSYFLAGLTREQLRSAVFPVGHLRKQEVRELARTMNLPSAETRDSQDACLVGPGQSFGEMLRQCFHAESRTGFIVDSAGLVLGRHAGIHHYTVGQRKGLAIKSTARHWVKAIRADDGTVVVTDDERDLCSGWLVASGLNWLEEGCSERLARCDVQVRYRHTAEPASVERTGPDAVRLVFERPVRAVTPGQAAVLYDGDRVLGRGWIQASE